MTLLNGITPARFHVTFKTQINKFVFYFTFRRKVKFGVPSANPCTKFDVKSGLCVFVVKPYNKPVERNVVYIPITTSIHATSITSE